MKFRNLFIVFMLIFIAGCDDKKDSSDKVQISIKKEAKLSQNLNAPFSIKLLNGEGFNMTRKENGYNMGNGKHATLFIYWATWCPPCIAEIKPLNNLNNNFQDKLKIIAVLTNDPISDKNLDDFIVEHNITYDITKDTELLTKTMGDIKGIPYMVLYDKNGVYDRHYLGIVPEEMLFKDIERVVDQ